MDFDDLSALEHQLVEKASEKYGAYYVNARDTSLLFSNLLMWPIIDCAIFLRFYAQMKKHHTLSLLSTVRLHRVQAKLVLRYFLESTANAAYSLAHQEMSGYFDALGKPLDSKISSVRAYRWIEQTYPASSDAIREAKKNINDATAHASLANGLKNLAIVPGDRTEIHTPFLDIEDEEVVLVDLWQCAQVGLIAIDLILAVQKESGGFIPTRQVDNRFALVDQNDGLLQALIERKRREAAASNSATAGG